MENVLDVCKRPYDPDYPVVCMDESPRQLIGELKKPIPAGAGRLEKFDYEYEHKGVCNVFMASNSLAGKRMVKITEHRKIPDWALFMEDIAENYQNAKRITLVMDNLNTHKPDKIKEALPDIVCLT